MKQPPPVVMEPPVVSKVVEVELPVLTVLVTAPPVATPPVVVTVDPRLEPVLDPAPPVLLVVVPVVEALTCVKLDEY